MYSVSASHSPRPPAFSELDPDCHARNQNAQGLAREMYEKMYSLPTRVQKDVMTRLIEIYNANVPDQSDRILPGKSDNFSQQYPKLNQLINKLEFIDLDKVGYFAFASGLFAKYLEARESNVASSKAKSAFFQEYFQVKGSDSGIAGLELLKSCDILFTSQFQKLDAILENIDVECLQNNSSGKDCPNFDHQLVCKILLPQLTGGCADKLARRLCIVKEVNNLLNQFDNSKSNFRLTVTFHVAAQQDKCTSDLITPLKAIGRGDLSERLQQALEQKGAPIPSDEGVHKKARYF